MGGTSGTAGTSGTSDAGGTGDSACMRMGEYGGAGGRAHAGVGATEDAHSISGGTSGCGVCNVAEVVV